MLIILEILLPNNTQRSSLKTKFLYEAIQQFLLRTFNSHFCNCRQLKERIIVLITLINRSISTDYDHNRSRNKIEIKTSYGYNNFRHNKCLKIGKQKLLSTAIPKCGELKLLRNNIGLGVPRPDISSTA